MKKKKNYKNGISVIIPTFNRAKYLYATLICLCNQKELPCDYEIIIIDSGSDDTEKVVYDFKNHQNVVIKYKRIQKCSNRSLLRNKGASLAKYSILCFLDNDMLVPPDFIKRHYKEHQKNDRLVLMQCRRLLTQFEIQQIGEEALINDFNILEKLPWYKDERLDIYEDKDQWRFVFSHTLSMRSNFFNKAGKFNKRFGEHWGFEDLELGFNLMQNGANFRLITDSFTYHQPHFSQSSKQQNASRFNKDLFSRLHNYYETELYSAFYLDYSIFMDNIIDANKYFITPKLYENVFFPKILGCIYSQKNPKKHLKGQLGVYIPAENKKYRKILILSTFFYFQELIQLSIIAEAFRVSNKVYFKNITEDQRDTVIILGKKGGLVLNFSLREKFTIFYVQDNCKSDFYTLILPEIYTPEKRFVYTWLCKRLIDNNKHIFLSDIHSSKTIEPDDLRLSSMHSKSIDKLFSNYLGTEIFQVIHSSSVYNSQFILGIGNKSNNIILHDDDFHINYQSLKFRGTHKCIHFSENQFANLTLASIYWLYKEQEYNYNSNAIEDKNYYLAFMENGFYEDGIDIILEGVAKVIQKYPKRKLTIKKPNYKLLFTKTLPLHNQASKSNKFFSISQKYLFDEMIMEKYINDLNLRDNVDVISNNMTMEEIIREIINHKSLIFMSRGCYVPPQVYVSIIARKETYIGEHHIIQNELKGFVNILKSQKVDFTNELKVPVSCMNIIYSAFRSSSEELFKEMIKNHIFNKNNDISEIYRIIEEKVKKAFVES